MQPKWHLYSQNLPKDGPLPTEFIFEVADTAFELLGKTEESKTVTAFDPIFENGFYLGLRERQLSGKKSDCSNPSLGQSLERSISSL